MPVRYTTWPGSTEPLFIAEPATTRLRETLLRVGVFDIPSHIWDCASRYACWRDPAIINEWVDVVQRYELRYDDGPVRGALRWQAPSRRTHLVRDLIESRLRVDPAPQCTWTGARLRTNHYEVDYALPWVHWNNSDLWNLLPATRQANREKRDRLPVPGLLNDAHDQTIEWWASTYLNTNYRD